MINRVLQIHSTWVPLLVQASRNGGVIKEYISQNIAAGFPIPQEYSMSFREYVIDMNGD